MAVLMLAVFAVPLALAEEDVVVTDGADITATDAVATNAAEITSADAEINQELDTSLNEEVSGGKVAWKQIQLWLTFKQEKKAERELDLARLRLIQARVAAKNGNEKAMEKAIEAHNKLIEKVKTRVNAIDGASDETGVKNTAVKLVGIERAIQVHEARIERLNVLLQNENLTQKQKEKVQMQIEKAQSVTEKLMQIESTKKEQVKTRLMAVKGMTEEEADAAIEKLEIKSGELADKIRERAKEKLAQSAADSEAEGV